MRATGIGSMPGDDLAGWARFVLGEMDLAFVPELPARGAHAGMIGRSLAVLDGMDADLQPAGWRVGVGSGVDHRRARSLLAQDLDAVEEIGHDYDGVLKQQVAGPWTLAATVETPRGEKVLADHGARRDLAACLAAGLAEQIADLRRRFGRAAEFIVQIDEPALSAVLAAAIPTSSGFGRYRTIDVPEADAHLRLVAETAREAGATPVVHCCAPDVPVALLRGAGFAAVAFDLSLVGPGDAWAEAVEQGLGLWPGSTDARRIEEFLGRLGFDIGSVGNRLVVTPPCGLAGRTPAEARRDLEAARSAARSLRKG
ncbi:MAG: methionine synthase [Aeromicrobium sp.]|uniref:methionine synthase n=1 Tax=Aeromicrobium sp. TaxID=1871063 RepID=UPI0039E3473F